MAPEEKPKARQPEYTLYRSRRRAAVAPGEEPKRRSLADLIVRAGAVAAAIGSIVAVVALVWPDSPARQGAKLSNVSRERNVSLADFAARQELSTVGPGHLTMHPPEQRRGTAQPGLAVVLLASAEVPSDGAGATPPEPEPTTPEPEPTTPGQKGRAQEPKDHEPVSRTPGGSNALAGGKEPPNATLGQTFQRITDKYKVCDKNTQCDPGAIDQAECNMVGECALDGGGGDGGGGDGGGAEPESRTEAIQSAKKFLRALRGTRVRRSSSASGSVTQEVLGVTVSFDLQLEGFKGRRGYVRWSLYNARANRRVPRDWLINRRVLSLQGKANEDRASKEFWVPLPRRKGPFFVRVSAYDDKGSRLTYEDTEPFR